MNFEEYFSYDALGLAELVRTNQISESELLEITIELCNRIDPKINAVPIKHFELARKEACLLYTSPSPRDGLLSRMPSSA